MKDVDIDDIVNGIKKDFGFTNMGRLSQDNVSSKVRMWVSTGSTLLDKAIANGIPIGRITEISGKSSTGKSALVYSILANVQKQGGLGVLLDTESAADPKFASILGVNVDTLIVSQPETIEDMYSQAFNFIKRIREKVDPDVPVVICADSCVPPSRAEVEKTLAEPAKIAENAFMSRRALKKIVNEISIHNISFIGINHLVANPMAMYGPKEIPTGGTAWAYFPSVRLQLRTSERIESKVKGVPEGIRITARVTKNRMGPPGREATFALFYDRGIDDIESLVEFGKQNGLFGSARGWLEYQGKKHRKDDLVKLFHADEVEAKWLKKECIDMITYD